MVAGQLLTTGCCRYCQFVNEAGLLSRTNNDQYCWNSIGRCEGWDVDADYFRHDLSQEWSCSLFGPSSGNLIYLLKDDQTMHDIAWCIGDIGISALRMPSPAQLPHVSASSVGIFDVSDDKLTLILRRQPTLLKLTWKGLRSFWNGSFNAERYRLLNRSGRSR